MRWTLIKYEFMDDAKPLVRKEKVNGYFKDKSFAGIM
jgi:hypothetical protein